MSILNDSLIWASVDPSVRACFRGSSAKKHLFPNKTELFKFTSGQLFEGYDQPISPWWCTVYPTLGDGDLGFNGLLDAAQAAGQSPTNFAREHLAVMFQWNALSIPQMGLGKVLRVQLLSPAYGFYGPASPQRNDRYPMHKNPVAGTSGWMKGGAIQIYVPNLTSGVIIDRGMHLLS